MSIEIDQQGRYVINDYHRGTPFASFLPGIAGPLGRPLWVFYVNRGQGIAGFGVSDKNSPIMEFQPANKAYQSVGSLGFRTFLKITSDGVPHGLHEPFGTSARPHRRTQLRIGLNEFEIRELDTEFGVETRVLYFVLPAEQFPALVRRLVIKNTRGRALSGEVLDGLPALIPYGVSNAFLKDMSNTVMAWMGVENLQARIPFFRVRASIEDRPEVHEFDAGHFYLCFSETAEAAGPLDPIVDARVIFGADTAFNYPERFADRSIDDLYRQPQVAVGRIPCAFFGSHFVLEDQQEWVLDSLIGHVDDVEVINRRAALLANSAYVERKHAEAAALGEAIARPVHTETSSRAFDLYCRQNYLDNVIRGGLPVLLPSGSQRPHVYYLYNRKHADLERDYNWFSLQPEYYAQGNGAYRDINQNRRWDVFFEPRIREYTIETFINLIQTDGYNPLEIRAATFSLSETPAEEFLQAIERDAGLSALLQGPFTPGHVLRHIEHNNLALSSAPDALLTKLLAHCRQEQPAEFVEGYWVDHWAYNLDLIESYLAIYPDHSEALFFDAQRYTFYDSAAVVVPSAERYVLKDGRVRQRGAVRWDQDKEAMIAGRDAANHLMRGQRGQGAVYRTHLFGKLLCLCTVKFATLDPLGMGVEMEAGKPGWYDPLNGLPALFGSSLSETYEIRRLIGMLQQAAQAYPQKTLALADEVYALGQDIAAALEDHARTGDHFTYWDQVKALREDYRGRTKYGFSGTERQVRLSELEPLLARFKARVEQGLQRAKELSGGLPPTYLSFEPVRWAVLQEDPDHAEGGTPVRVLEWTPRALPPFLEGVVKEMRCSAGPTDAQTLHERVKDSPLYDKKLKMFKANASLSGEPVDIGRVRAFTPGWLENESVFLHMHYKYLLALLQAGLGRQFWEEARCGLVPFLDPATYGRSILENSSFIVSSAHPDQALHGKGFVARLSGSSAEFIHMWILTMVGPAPFGATEDGLTLRLSPELPGWLFRDSGTISFVFLGASTVTYHNPERKDLFPGVARLIRISTSAGQGAEFPGAVIQEPWASRIRAKETLSIDVSFE